MKTENNSASDYDAKIETSETLVSEFNKAQKVLRLDEGTLRTKLASIGVTSEESLAFLTVEDLFTNSGIPPVLARQIVAVLKGQSGATKSRENPSWVSPRMVDRMSCSMLLGHYNPEEDDAVSRKLKELSKGESFVVFLPTGGIDIETSEMLLSEIRKGFHSRPNGVIQVGETFRTIHKVGINPDCVLDENPIYKGRALRPDGTCDQINRSWTGVDLEMRQLFWLAINETREFGEVTLDKAHAVMDVALDKTLGMVKVRYPQAAALLEEKKTEGTLPTLKLKSGKAATPAILGKGNNSPFGERA